MFVCTHSELPYHNIGQLERLAERYSKLCQLEQSLIPILSISSRTGDGLLDVIGRGIQGCGNGTVILSNHTDIDYEDKQIEKKDRCQII